MKRIISVVITAFIAVSMITPVFADDKITADEVKELIEASSLLSEQPYCDKLLNARLYNSDNMLEKIFLRDIVKPEKTYVWYDATQLATEDDNGNMIIMDISYSILSDEEKYFMDSSDEEAALIGIYNSGTPAKEEFPLIYTNYERTAEMLNNDGLKNITDIRFYPLGLMVTADGVEYIVNEFGFETYSSYDEKQKEANQEHERESEEIIKKMRSLTPSDMLDWYDADGSDIEDTNSLSAYRGAETVFFDLGDDPFLRQAANMLYDRKIISGYEDGTFRPNNTLTRAEATVTLAKLVKGDYKSGAAFTDTENHWSADAVSYLTSANVIHGYDDGLFHPDDPLTFGQASWLIYSILGGCAINRSDKDYMVIMMEEGLFKGIESFASDTSVTRADFAKMLANAFDMHMIVDFTRLNGLRKPHFFDERDITLADYLDGKEIKHGELRVSREGYDSWERSFINWYERTYKGVWDNTNFGR